MQLVKCQVALGGDVRAQVPKARITVPELVVLEAIHGSGSVTEVEVVGMDKRPHGEELARLHKLYGRAGEQEGRNIVAQLFPGYAPQLPVRLSDIGKAAADDEGEDDSPAPRRAKKKASKKKTAKKTAAKAPADEGNNDGDSDPDTGDEDNDDALS